MPTIHTLTAERRTLHGHFSRDLAPILTIDPGDSIRANTLDAGWGIEPFVPGKERAVLAGRDPVLDDGHAMIGPIAVRGAQLGMTLAVHINRAIPGAWGGNMTGGWPSPMNIELNVTEVKSLHAWTLDREAMVGRNQHGHRVALRPFLGVMGMPPDEPGVHSTIPPRWCGGNLDCKELVAGSTLYLPIPVKDALFSFGDGHGAQGDGEVSGTAIECPMDLVDLTLDLRDDFPLTTPAALTPTGWLTLGFDVDLNKATLIALEAMLALMGRLHGLSRIDALGLASLVVDLRITQVVNNVRGVHALLPHGALQV